MREFPNLYTDISALTQINRPGSLKEALTGPNFPGGWSMARIFR